MTSLSQERLQTGVSAAGIVIRYSFYLLGALFFGMIALGTFWVYGARLQKVDAQPAFRIANGDISKLPMRSQVVTGGRFGRVEIRQYGQLYHRNVDFTIAMIMRPQDQVSLTRDGLPVLPNVKPLRTARSVSTNVNYDIDTRLGDYRATELRVDADGQWKQCLAFVSRFETEALSVAGWYCDASGAKPSPDRLACLLDKFTLDAPLASREADKFVREQLARSPSCSASPVSQTVDTGARRRSSPANWSMPNARRSGY
jgi:hypothetical protein